MPASGVLLKHVAKAFVKYAGNAVGFGFAGDLLVEIGPDLVGEIWDSWARDQDESERKTEIERVVRATADEVREQIAELMSAVAPTANAQVREAATQYLLQVPATLRSTLRRPADPSGTTIPAGFAPTNAEDLLTFLPRRLPRFKPGDRPLTGVDWELTELLGVGGFGEVWKAHNPHFDGVPPVALKFCLDPAAKERLLKHEAAILNRVMRQGQHPGIVQLQNTFLAADPPCLAYEYVDGGDLAGFIQKGRSGASASTPQQAATIVSRLAEIVGFAHGLNPPIVHRDLKPANILMQTSPGEDVRFKIADFGIGGLAANRAIAAAATGVSQASLRMDSLQGSCTPLYASPQQLRGMPPDPRDDVYALGVIWYQLLTGDLGSGRPGGSRWRQKLLEDGMPAPLVAVLESCFEDDPADRPDDAAALAQTLNACLHSEPRSAAGATVRPQATSSAKASSPVKEPGEGSPRDPDCLTGHAKAVLCLAFSADAARLVSGSRDETLCIWDVRQRRLLQSCNGHTDAVYCVAISPDGQQVLSGGKDKTVRLWDMASGREVGCFAGHADTVYGVAFRPPHHALSCGGDASLRLWNLRSGRQEQTFAGKGDRIYSLALSPSARQVLYGCEDHTLRLWDIERGAERACLRGHAGSVLCVAFAADERRALSGSMDKTMRLWDLKKGREIACFDLGIGSVASVAMSPDVRFALSGSIDRTVRLWDLSAQCEARRFAGHADRVIAVAFSQCGTVAASGSYDTTLRLWTLGA